MNKMKVMVTKQKNGFEAVVSMPNLTATKLKKDDGTTVYSSLHSLYSALDNAAKKYNCTFGGAGAYFKDLDRFNTVAAKRSVKK